MYDAPIGPFRLRDFPTADPVPMTEPTSGTTSHDVGIYIDAADQWLAEHDAEWMPARITANPDSTMAPYRGHGPMRDVGRQSGNVSIDALTIDLSDGGQTDPQNHYRTASGKALMREAIRQTLRTSLDLQSVQETIRQASNGIKHSTIDETNALPDHGKGFQMSSGAFRAARTAVLKAHAALVSVASEALPAYGPSADRWAVRGPADPLTYGGPVVHEQANPRLVDDWGQTRTVWAVDAAGSIDALPPMAFRRPVMVAMHAQARIDGQYRPEVIPLPWMAAADALARTDSQWIEDQWTGYRPDRLSQSADRFALARRPTMGETADPLPAVRKPSSRKRKRDGAVGGPMTIGHR